MAFSLNHLVVEDHFSSAGVERVSSARDEKERLRRERQTAFLLGTLPWRNPCCGGESGLSRAAVKRPGRKGSGVEGWARTGGEQGQGGCRVHLEDCVRVSGGPGKTIDLVQPQRRGNWGWKVRCLWERVRVVELAASENLSLGQVKVEEHLRCQGGGTAAPAVGERAL